MTLLNRNLAMLPLLALLLAGCTTPQQPIKTQPNTVYLLDHGDEVNINVSGEQDMSMRVKIDNSGNVDYPFIGVLQLKGKTPEEVSKEIADKLRGNYLQKPMVTVSIAEYRKVYLLGEVKKPDGYAWEPGLTAEKAIALAGGFTDRADRKDIQIRQSGSGQLLNNVAADSSVQAGDTIIIGMSFF
ncbi:polysaccharide biosynthesis/export family protein [Pluralibacter sp.]|uniref:polysaccharide biosynthesis/export family protein n=1 Tax=Pluralibacter sp. TaxID=1920032 RepID=UPI0025D69DFD|nr:polysaccharide biosynthesis/export family protein [Pluralibacter sp.]MBV8043659.1 polysaccharide export protein [Pluralibacter sp.]